MWYLALVSVHSNDIIDYVMCFLWLIHYLNTHAHSQKQPPSLRFNVLYSPQETVAHSVIKDKEIPSDCQHRTDTCLNLGRNKSSGAYVEPAMYFMFCNAASNSHWFLVINSAVCFSLQKSLSGIMRIVPYS